MCPKARTRLQATACCGINHAVAGVIAVIRRMTQHATDQTGVFLPADQAGDLTVGGDFAAGDFSDGGKDFVGEAVVFGAHKREVKL